MKRSETTLCAILGRRILNIAHRGARSLAPENTLAAARKALSVGADMWELDVCAAADGEPIVIHDSTLERTSNVRDVFPLRAPWMVHGFTLAEIRQLDFGSWFNRIDPFGQIAAGAVTEAEMRSYVGLRAPTLREALEFTAENDWLVNVEIKDLGRTAGHSFVVEKVVKLVEELGMEGKVLISSFNHAYLERVGAANPSIVTGALASFAHRNPPALLCRLKASCYHPRITAIRRRRIASLRDEGVHVLVWVANKPSVMRALIDSRVSGIFTDFPQVLKTVLDDSWAR